MRPECRMGPCLFGGGFFLLLLICKHRKKTRYIRTGSFDFVGVPVSLA